jgi:hypothetical protein
MMTFVSADGGWVAEYAQGASWYNGGSNVARQAVALNNSGNINLLGANYNNSDDGDYRAYMLEVDPGNATVTSSSRWTGQNDNASNTQNISFSQAQYNYQQGKWYCNVGGGQWYEADGTTVVNGGAMLVLNDNGAYYDTITAGTAVPNSSMYYRVATNSSDYGWFLMTGGDTIRYYYKVDTSYNPIRVYQAYEAQSSSGWSSTRGITVSPNMSRFAVYNTDNNEFGVSFHPRGTSNLSYYARKVPGNDSGSGYDTNNFDNLESMDNSYWCYPCTYNNSNARPSFIRIEDGATYYVTRFERKSYNGTNAFIDTTSKQVPEASGSYVYGFSILVYYQSGVYKRAGIIWKFQKSDMSVVDATAFIRTAPNPPGNTDNTFGQPYHGFSLTQDEDFLLIGGTTKNSHEFGNDPLYIIKHPVDFTQMSYGTKGNWYFWDFTDSSTGGTYPTITEVLTTTTTSASTYTRSLNISNSGQGNYDSDNGQNYNTRGTNDPFTVTKTDIT